MPTKTTRLLAEPIVRTNRNRIEQWRNEGRPLALIAEMLGAEYGTTISGRQVSNGLNRQKWAGGRKTVEQLPAEETARASPRKLEPGNGPKRVHWNPNPDPKDLI